jgi:hypothetical protein
LGLASIPAADVAGFNRSTGAATSVNPDIRNFQENPSPLEGLDELAKARSGFARAAIAFGAALEPTGGLTEDSGWHANERT